MSCCTTSGGTREGVNFSIVKHGAGGGWAGFACDVRPPQHFLCFLPLPHGQGSLRPILSFFVDMSLFQSYGNETGRHLAEWSTVAVQSEAGEALQEFRVP